LKGGLVSRVLVLVLVLVCLPVPAACVSVIQVVLRVVTGKCSGCSAALCAGLAAVAGCWFPEADSDLHGIASGSGNCIVIIMAHPGASVCRRSLSHLPRPMPVATQWQRGWAPVFEQRGAPLSGLGRLPAMAEPASGPAPGLARPGAEEAQA
jgi:hypothetical protein